jgi:LmbE family N-acetylglucosaminyl deacetylase
MADDDAPTPLAPLDEDWERALVVVAHPDDVEFGAAAAVARWTDQGKTVVYCMVTSGEAGIDALPPDECRAVREREQVESARVVGVEVVEFLGFPDGVVEPTVALRAAIAEQVRRHRPDVVVTGNHHDTWGGSAPNQADHVAVGRSTIHAVQDAGNRWIHREQLVDGLEPWGGVRQVWVAGSPVAQHGVDTTATFDRGVASLEAHRAYIDGLGWEHFDPAEFLEGMSRPTGSRMGVTHAAAFEVVSMTWGD